MRKTSFLTAGLIWALSAPASQAAGEHWKVTHEPKRTSDGSPICQIWHGTQPPLIGITAAKGAQLLAVAADDLKAVESPQVQGAMRFLSRRSYALRFTVKKSGSAGPNAVAMISDADIGSIMVQIALGGTVTVEVGNSVDLNFPIDGAASESTAFMRCRDKL